ncbi:MAG: hypothetical protein ACJ76B_10995 [Solirubrobacterales bacterium]
MRRLILSALSAVLLGSLGASPATAEDFGLANLDVRYENADGSPALLAGSHPYAITFDLDSRTEELPGGLIVPAGAAKTIKIEQPSGFAGVPSAAETCPAALFLEAASDEEKFACPNDTVLGKTTVTVGSAGKSFTKTVPVYNMEAPPGAILKLGFIVQGIPVTFEVGLSPVYPFNPLVTISNVSQAAEFYASSTTVWGNPASSAHDTERGTCLTSGASDECPISPAKEIPFLLLPRSCTGPLSTIFEATSWQNPATWVKEPPVLSHDDSLPPQPKGLSGCDELEFDPEVAAKTTTQQATSGSGLDFNLAIDDEGILDPDGRAQSDIKRITLTLPEGMSANPSLAAGLGVCSAAEFAAESVDSQPGDGCPETSKIGTVQAESPLLEGTVLKGELFVAEPYANPFGELLALYLVVREPKLGIFVALPGKIEADAVSGRLTTIFGEAPFEIPQFPISNLQVQLRTGDRAPLVTPPACGSYGISTELIPWADPTTAAATGSTFQITAGPDAGSCPPSPLPFSPGFKAGSISNQAASHSPFYLELSRSDAEHELSKFEVKLPPGVTATLAGTGRCSDAAIAAASAHSGREELASPSCPADSRVGKVLTGAGVGSQLTWVEGSLYLAGPYRGAPLSAVAVVPAVAGPFDLGTVVVRQPLRVDSRSGQVTVDASADPLPRILQGIPLRVREIQAYIDRPGFMLNPTNCDPLAVAANIWGGASVAATDRYQAAGCGSLGFKPKLSLKLKGGTRRSDNPALRALLTTRSGNANIAKAVVTLPRTAFLDQSHIRTVCTRVQFAAHSCPKGSRYGFARAWTPILDAPAEGPVYLRSSNNTLPDLVMALKGPASAPVEVEVVGRIDSNKGGIRTSFEGTPDLPVSKLLLTMQGGKKGLIDNSRNLCGHTSRAVVRLGAHNAKRSNFRPVVKATGCKKPKKR